MTTLFGLVASELVALVIQINVVKLAFSKWKKKKKNQNITLTQASSPTNPPSFFFSRCLLLQTLPMIYADEVISCPVWTVRPPDP